MFIRKASWNFKFFYEDNIYDFIHLHLWYGASVDAVKK